MQKKKLRVAVLAGKFPCISEAFILNQILYLVDQGHTIDIYVYGKDNEAIHPAILEYNLLERTIYQSVPESFWVKLKTVLFSIYKAKERLSLLKTLSVFHFGKSALSLRIFFKCLAFSDAPPYDIVHAHYGTRGNDVIDIKKAGFLRNTPLITTFHGFDINPLDKNYNKKNYSRLFRKSSVITANSNYTLNLLLEVDCPVDKVVKLPVSLNTDFFKKLPVSREDPTTVNIVFCGRFIAFKAPDLVIEIAKQIIIYKGYKNVIFHLVGNGEMRQEIQREIDIHHLSSQVILHGALVQHKIIELLSEMDIFLYPGIYDSNSGRAENQGLVLQEAQSLELPVITSNVGGIAEGVIHDETGFIEKEKDIRGFAEKVELLIENKELRRKMGMNARKYVIDNFDSRILCKKLEQHYYNCLNNTI